MKTIFVPIEGKVYKVNQDTHIPSTLCNRPLGTSASLQKDPDNAAVLQTIFVNTIQQNNLKSNRELYLDMLEMIKREKITELLTIEDSFKIYIDYTLYVDNKIVDKSVVIKPVIPTDEVLPLGCGTNNELLYRRVKNVKSRVSFKVRNSLPYGVMNVRNQNYRVQINDIAVFQDFSPYREMHQSGYEVPYPQGSKNINLALSDCMLMYSTDNAGLVIQPLELNFAPRIVDIDVEVILGNPVVAYDDAEVKRLIAENIHHEYNPDDPEPPSPGPYPPIPPFPFDPHRPADGHDEADKHGHSDWYERATATNPGALLVVEDYILPTDYDPKTMVKKFIVYRDIPDIQVGEYVLYREGFDASLS